MWNPQANEDQSNPSPVDTTNILQYDGTILTSIVNSITTSQNVSGVTINVNDPTNSNAPAKLNVTLTNIFNAIPNSIEFQTYGTLFAGQNNTIQSTSPMTDGQILIGSTDNPPVLGVLYDPNDQISIIPQAEFNRINIMLNQFANVTFNSINLTSGSIVNAPINPTDIVNKAYVDQAIAAALSNI